MIRRSDPHRFFLLLFLASPIWTFADEPAPVTHEEVVKRNEKLRAADVPQIFIETRYIEVDTSMYDLVIDGYEPAKHQDSTLPVATTNVIQVLPKNTMRETSARKDKPIPFGMQHLYANMEDSSHFEAVVLNGVAEFKLGATEYDFHDHTMPKSFPEDPGETEELIGVDYLHAPRLLVFSGQRASISSGYHQPYLIKDDDGCLRLSAGNDFTDGTNLEVGATLQDDGNILLDPLMASFSQMVGREKIEGVPLDVGKPIVQTASMSMSLIMNRKSTAVFALPRFDESAPVILVLIRTYEAKQTPPTPTATHKKP